MRASPPAPLRDNKRPGLWARLRFALWLFWQRLRRRSDA